MSYVERTGEKIVNLIEVQNYKWVEDSNKV